MIPRRWAPIVATIAGEIHRTLGGYVRGQLTACLMLSALSPAIRASSRARRRSVSMNTPATNRVATVVSQRAMGELPAIYGSAFLHLNLSQTGSMDKTILESLACGCPTLIRSRPRP